MPFPKLSKRSKRQRSQMQDARSKRRASRKNQPEVDMPPESASYAGERASKRKLGLGKESLVETNDLARQEWLLVHLGQINELIAGLPCPDCLSDTGLKVDIDPQQHQGFSSRLMLGCRRCSYSKSVFTSPRLLDETRQDVAFDINTRMVLLAHELGLGHAALRKFSEVLGIPGMSQSTYQKHNKTVSAVEIERGLESLHGTREMVRRAYADVDPDVAELLREDPDAVIDIGVSFDGTWQKSNYGIGVCIDILTGLVIDYEVLSSYCHACVLKACAVREKKMTEQEFASWREAHTDCAKNFQGSSKAMEQESAKRMWGRSVNLHQVRYTQMLSDGDSAAFREVVALNPYQGITVEKLECINHAHKRMGTALRKLCSQGKLGGKGVGKLTAQKCKTLENYYRGAILSNQGSIDGMKAAIWADLLHSMSSDENPMHDKCSPLRCWYNKAEENGVEPDSHSLHSENFLTREEGKKLIPVYHRMTSDSLLQRMQHGGTQNTNECLNTVIWAQCPKTIFVGKSRIEAAVGKAVATFNEGASAMQGVMDKLWLQTIVITLDAMREVDLRRVSKAEAIMSAAAKRRRKSLSTAKKTQQGSAGNG